MFILNFNLQVKGMNGGGMISTLQPSYHPENRRYPNQMSPASIRRESASAIYDFFEDFLSPSAGEDINVNVSMKLMSRHPNTSFTSSQRTIRPRQVPQVPTSDWPINKSYQQNSSSSFIEELFAPCGDDTIEKRLLCNTKEPGMDVKPKFPASELPTALEKMSEKFWDLEDLNAIEIPDDVCERTSSTSSMDSSCASTTTTQTNNILTHIPSATQVSGQLLDNGVQIKTEVDMTPVMSCNFQSGNVPSVVKMEPCLPTYSASCNTANKPTPGLLSSPGGMYHPTIRPTYLPLTSSNASMASSMAPVSNMATVKMLAAGSNTFTVVPSQGQSGVPVVLQSVMLPPTPPDSQPNSPNQQLQNTTGQQQDMRQTPPPPYPGVPILPAPDLVMVSNGLLTSTGKARKTHPGCTTIKYNRRNNPDLEKRRVHYCEFRGEKFL